MAVPTQVDQNGLTDAIALALERLFDGGTHGMVRFRSGQDALGARELHTGFEALELLVSAGFDEPQLLGEADERRHPVVSQSTSVKSRRSKRRSECVHLRERRQ